MDDLDLVALEHRFKQLEAWAAAGIGEFGGADDELPDIDFLALMQRIRDLVGARNLYSAAADERWRQLKKADARIVELERVRDAAAVVVDWWLSAYQLAPEKHVVDELRAALEAVGKSKDG